MGTLTELAHLTAEYLPVWRDAAVLLLAALVIGCLYVVASVYGE